MKKSPKTSRNRVPRKVPRSNDLRAAAGSFVLCKSPAFDSVVVTLRYTDPTFIHTMVGTVTTFRYRMNSVYDPDPNILSGSVSMFNEWAAMYNHYRVLRFHYKITLSNMSTLPLMISTVPTKIDLGANFSGAVNFPEAPYGRASLISAQGGQDRIVLSGTIDLAKFSGHAGYLYDDITGSQVSSSPSSLYYFNIGVNSSQTNIGTVCANVTLTYETLFYDRLSPFT